MKNFVKWFGITAFVMVIAFSLVGCDLIDHDFQLLNGVWDRGDIVVTFDNYVGVFTQINPSSNWQTALNNGTIRIGDRKFRNISKTGNLKWTCQELLSNGTTWVNCTLTMDANGQTLQAYNPNSQPTPTSTTYTKR